MTDHSPALIAAAKALAEKHGWRWFGTAGLNALCEALSTTPPSEESAMSVIPKHTVAASDNNRPEPTEDHLRRACEELGVNYETFVAGVLGDFAADAVRTVARLLAERDELLTTNTDQAATIVCLAGERDAMQAEIASLRDYITEPDPDLVLAREAAAQEEDARENFNISANIRLGTSDFLVGVQSALRALKLAKEQAHE